MFAASKSGSVSAPTDSKFNYVTMLLHGNGTNGAQNNTFVDSSTNNFTITRNGNTTQGTFTPYGSNWSNYFDGSGDYLQTPSNAAFDLSTGNWTIELWVYLTASYDNYYGGHLIGSAEPNTGTGGWSLVLRSGSIVVLGGGNSQGIYAVNFQLNTWNHIAFVRSGTGANSASLYFNGVPYTATGNGAGNPTFNSTNGPVYIGEHPSYTVTAITGYISNARVVKGTAVYAINQSSITVPTAPLTAITNTSLLTCQSNRFIDNSTNNFTITKNGDTRVQRFSPFSPTTAYSTSVIGGSGYFDGSGDRLSSPANTAIDLSTADFTIDCWVYPTSFSATKAIIVYQNGDASNTNYGYWLFVKTTGVVRFENFSGSSQVGFDSSIAMNLNTWNHIAVTRTGTSATTYINGVGTTGTVSATFNAPVAAILNIGDNYGASFGSSNPYLGYMTDLRIVKGTRVYTTNFTPPTAPLTAITNTQLLCNFTNAGILDNAMMNDLETVGNAQISTSVKKYGTGSMYFDGTGDWVSCPASPQWLMAGDWTIECWIYPNSVTGVQVLVETRNRTTNASPCMYLNGTNLVIDTGTASVVSAGTITISTWQHVAATRSGNSWRIFINGTQVGSTTTNTTSYTTAYGCCIGSSYYNEHYNGYIDDLRITKGYARYTTTFTPPTAAFPDKG